MTSILGSTNILENESVQEYTTIGGLGEETSSICLLVAVHHVRPDIESLVARPSGDNAQNRSASPKNLY